MITIRAGVVYDADKNILGEFDNLVFVPSTFHLEQPLRYHDEVRRELEQYKRTHWTGKQRVRAYINELIEKNERPDNTISLVGLSSFFPGLASHIPAQVIREYEEKKILKYVHPLHKVL